MIADRHSSCNLPRSLDFESRSASRSCLHVYLALVLHQGRSRQPDPDRAGVRRDLEPRDPRHLIRRPTSSSRLIRARGFPLRKKRPILDGCPPFTTRTFTSRIPWHIRQVLIHSSSSWASRPNSAKTILLLRASSTSTEIILCITGRQNALCKSRWFFTTFQWLPWLNRPLSTALMVGVWLIQSTP